MRKRGDRVLVSQCSPHTPIQLLLGTAATTIGLHLGLASGPSSFIPHPVCTGLQEVVIYNSGSEVKGFA